MQAAAAHTPVTIDDRHGFETALWQDACLAADMMGLFVGEGRLRHAGIVIKGHAGPVRDLWMERLRDALPNTVALRTIPAGIAPDRLIGGLDLSATLAAGHKVLAQGLLSQAHGHVLLLPMADIADAETVALIGAAMDNGVVRVERDGVGRTEPASFGLVAFDESASDEEGAAPGLQDRMALHIDLSEISIRTARQRFRHASAPAAFASLSDDQRSQICTYAASLGLLSLRPSMQAIELAKAHCRLLGRTEMEDADIAAAVRLGLAHRALYVAATPPPEEASQEAEAQPNSEPERSDPTTPDDKTDTETDTTNSADVPDTMLLDALASALPPGLLARPEKRSRRPVIPRQGGTPWCAA